MCIWAQKIDKGMHVCSSGFYTILSKIDSKNSITHTLCLEDRLLIPIYPIYRSLKIKKDAQQRLN